MTKKFLSIIFFLMISWQAPWAKGMFTSHKSFSYDSLILISGNVLSVAEEKPIIPKITFRSLPYGSITGFYQFEEEDGSYHFSVLPGQSYQIEISSPGYQTAIATIDPIQEAKDGMIDKDFYLYKTLKKGDVFKMKEKIFFDQGNARLREESTAGLEELATLLKQNPGLTIQLEGHTDIGNRKTLMVLSEARVRSVKKYLVDQGIDSKRIKTKAYGGTKPLSLENTPEARQINRRVEIRILKL